MTFVLSRCGDKSIWLMADTRLTAGDGSSFRDDGTKLLTLDTTDATCLIGYAGLGATAAGTQPSEWMARCLTGINVPLEHAVDTIARVMTEKFPQHSGAVPNLAILHHQVIFVAFSEKIARRFIIRLTPNQNGSGSAYRWTEIPPTKTSRFFATGSLSAVSGVYPLAIRNRLWHIMGYDKAPHYRPVFPPVSGRRNLSPASV